MVELKQQQHTVIGRNARIATLLAPASSAEKHNNGYVAVAAQENDDNNNNSKRASAVAHTAAEPAGIQIKSNLSPRAQLIVQNLSMVYLTLIQTLNPLMVRAAHKNAHQTGRPFLSSTIVLNTEVVKLLMSCVILVFSYGSIWRFINELSCAFLKNKRETLKVCVPALIYVVQNNLYFFALKRVEATLFSISYQLRILTTALLSMLLLRRVFSRTQWSALCISVIGVCLVQLGSTGGGGSSKNAGNQVRDEQFLGLVTVFVMCWTSAFAGVYLEGVLKQSSCDIWMQNIRLSVITLPFALLTIANDIEQIGRNGLLSGWNWLLWTIVLTSSSSGLVVAAVMKYADNIKKSYCQSVALGGTALLSILAGDSQFSFALLAGVSLVIGSVFLYTLNPPRVKKSPTPDVPDRAIDEDDEEAQSLLDELDDTDEDSNSSSNGWELERNLGKLMENKKEQQQRVLLVKIPNSTTTITATDDGKPTNADETAQGVTTLLATSSPVKNNKSVSFQIDTQNADHGWQTEIGKTTEAPMNNVVCRPPGHACLEGADGTTAAETTTNLLMEGKIAEPKQPLQPSLIEIEASSNCSKSLVGNEHH